MAPPRTVPLDGILQSVMTLAVAEEDDLFYVASSSGLHEFVLSTGRLVKTVKFGMCMDVMIADVVAEIAHNDGVFKGGRAFITVFSLSSERLGLDQEAYIRLYPYQGSNKERQEQEWTPILEIASQHEWGRIRKLAYSKKQGCLYISTKFDHDMRGKYQNSAVWKVDIAEPGLGKLLIYKESASMWYMAVDDERNFLIVSDRGDDFHHSIDVYDSGTGQHLKTIGTSPKVFPRFQWVPYGFILWPRGVAVDSLGRVYVVDSGRIQEFDAVTGKFVALIERFPLNNPKGVVLIEKTHVKRRLYVIGSQNSRKVSEKDPVHKCALFVCDVQDWCSCKECAFQSITSISRANSF